MRLFRSLLAVLAGVPGAEHRSSPPTSRVFRRSLRLKPSPSVPRPRSGITEVRPVHKGRGAPLLAPPSSPGRRRGPDSTQRHRDDSLPEDGEARKTVIVGPASRCRIEGRHSIFSILGRLLVNVRGLFDARSNRGTLGARGTEFEVTVNERGDMQVLVLDGNVDLQRSREQVRLDAAPWILAVAMRGRMQQLPQPAAVGRLEEVTIQAGIPDTSIMPAAEDRVRAAVNWGTQAILSGRPTYPARRTIPNFADDDTRARAFREARFDAIWRRTSGSFEALGRVYSDWEDGARALESFGREARVNPERGSSPTFLAGVGEALRMTGRLKEAEQLLSKARDAEHDNQLALNGLGNVYFAQADAAEDAGDLNTARTLVEKSLALYAESTQRRGDAQGIAASVTWANEGDAKLLLGDVALDEKRLNEANARYSDARTAFAAAARVDARSPFGLLGSADAARRIGAIAQARGDKTGASRAYQEAEAQYRKTLATHPDLSAAHLGLGDVFLETARRPQAVESYRRAVMVRPDSAAAQLRLGLVLMADDPRSAAQHLRAFLDVAPPSKKQGRAAATATKALNDLSVKGRLPEPKPPNNPVPSASELLVPTVKNLLRDEAVRILERWPSRRADRNEGKQQAVRDRARPEADCTLARQAGGDGRSGRRCREDNQGAEPARRQTRQRDRRAAQQGQASEWLPSRRAAMSERFSRRTSEGHKRSGRCDRLAHRGGPTASARVPRLIGLQRTEAERAA